MSDFELTEHDKSSILWARMREHLEDRLAAARVRNDMPMGKRETASLRGEIRAMKRIIALGDSRPILTGDGDGAP